MRNDNSARHFVLKASTVGFRLATGALENQRHHHREAQLLFLVKGELTCEASGAWWVVPPGSALWVPSDIEHRISAKAPLEGYNLYLDPDATASMPADCCAIATTPLFREVMMRLATGPTPALVEVLLEELPSLSIDKHRLPMPSDPRLQKLAALLTVKPADRSDMQTWAKRIGVAERTLNRLLKQETGLSFGRWRQQLHVILAIQRMARGASVQLVASELGYESASSFVVMFRKALGTSPGRYMATRAQAGRTGSVE